MSIEKPTVLRTIVRPRLNLAITVGVGVALLVCVGLSFAHPEWQGPVRATVTALLIAWSAVMAWRFEKERVAWAEGEEPA